MTAHSLLAEVVPPPEGRVNALWGTAKFLYLQLVTRHLSWSLGYVPMVAAGAFFAHQHMATGYWLVFAQVIAPPALCSKYLPRHLPISRHRVLALSLVPGLLALCVVLGVASRNWGAPTRDDGTGLVFHSNPVTIEVAADAAAEPVGHRMYRVASEAALWKLSWGAPEPLLLPTGQVVQPAQVPLLGPLFAYDPYSASPADSVGVATTQIVRALDACCQLRLTPAQVRSHLEHRGPGALSSLMETARRAKLARPYFDLSVAWALLAGAFLALGRVPQRGRTQSTKRRANQLVGMVLVAAVAGFSAAAFLVGGGWSGLPGAVRSGLEKVWLLLQQIPATWQAYPVAVSVLACVTTGWLYRAASYRFARGQ